MTQPTQSAAGADVQYESLKDVARRIFALTRDIDEIEVRLATRKAARQQLIDQLAPILNAIESELQITEFTP